MKIICKDGTVFDEADGEVRIRGSVKKVRDREVNKPAVIGQFPVYVEQFGSYKLTTFSSKIKEIIE